MALLIKATIRGYSWIFTESRDLRTDEYWLISSLPLTLGLGALYLYFVKILGPKFMEARQPYNLDQVIKVYNFLQIIANLYLVVMAFPHFMKLSIFCSPVDYSNSPDAIQILKLLYLYFLIKIVDLLDTVFFIMRKKYNQITFLHVYHHYGVVYLAWVGMKFFGGGHSFFLPVLNSMVHSAMYFYYFLTSVDEKYKKNVWWKKHITQLQLVQFFLLIIIYGAPLISSNCAYPKFPSYMILGQAFFMFALFSDFYKRAYWRTSKKVNNKED